MSDPTAQPILCGTTAWSFKDWVGSIYPVGTESRDYLQYYAKHYPIVEVDSSFYAVPRVSVVERWGQVTPDAFRFSLKVPREVTHERVLVDCEEVMEAFLSAIEPLGEKLLCVLLQFGYFNRQKFSSPKGFYERLDGFLGQYASRVPMVCEIRNKWWLKAEYFEILRRHKVAAALIEQSWMPGIDLVAGKHPALTADFAYVRLLGDRQGIEEITTTWDQVVIDRGEDLARVATTLREIAKTTAVYTFVNNHYAGYAPQTIRELRAELDADAPEARTDSTPF